MRKRYWVVLAFLALAGLGNLIGGTDMPGQAAVDPAGGSGVVRAEVPAVLRFDATMYVSASSLNLREVPSTGGSVLTSLPRNTRVRGGGWVLVSAQVQGSKALGLMAGRSRLAALLILVNAAPAETDISSRFSVMASSSSRAF
ncbi:SH3 domain-containing protein [Devosia sp. SL43]|uniref:SH3 domain-containing protein n=1 Tax=Devosia sp. SL43 TaxID=2806348 RepID=UPI001F396E7E|nr:SH3 domain-containing protein [Devosia sp. SL43]UJW86821.1 hypothetical protein IM737_06115 [Devosia sp. SL43]